MSVNRRFLISIFVLFSFNFLNAQTGISLQSRHVLNPNTEIRLRNYIFNRSFLASKGIAFEIFRSREKKLYAFSAGFHIMGAKGDRFNNTSEVYLQAQFKLFNDLYTKPKLCSFFSLGPRLYTLQGSANATGPDTFPSNEWILGIEVPAIFSTEFVLNEKLRIMTQVNVLSLSFGFDRREVNNPSLPVNLQINSGFDIDLRTFNELRIGLGYMF